MNYEEYLIEHEHSGQRPKCECGCGDDAPYTKSQGEGFKKFIHGHHARGRMKTEEEKQKIGEANSVKMKKYLADNPDVVRDKVQSMRSGHTEQTREIINQKLSDYNRSDEGRERASAHMKEMWQEDRETMDAARIKATETFKERIADGTYRDAGGFGSEQWRDRVSHGISQKYLEGGFEWSRGEYLSSKTGKKSYYRSSWELRRMEELDTDQTVTTWRHEPFFLDYEFEGKKRRYLPDFLVEYADGSKFLEEIGVKVLKDSLRNQAKFDAARILCSERGWQFRIISF